MLELILSHRNVVGQIKEDVGGLKNGIVKEATIHEFLALGLLFELRHARQVPKGGDASQNPTELGVLGHSGLEEKDGALRIDSAGQKVQRELPPVFLELLRNGVFVGEGMVVHNAIDAKIPLLKLHPLLDGTEIVAEMEHPRGLDSREDPHPFLLLSQYRQKPAPKQAKAILRP
jgi:hypothetical protein